MDWVRLVLDQVKPKRAKLTLEMCPWTLLDGPEIYFDLLQAIDRPGLGVHLDPANLVTHPRAFYDTSRLINRCFDRLGPHVVSCHAKDVQWTVDARTVGIEEVVPGRGVLEYRTLVRWAHRVSPNLPLIIEHLETEANFDEAAQYIKGVCLESDVPLLGRRPTPSNPAQLAGRITPFNDPRPECSHSPTRTREEVTRRAE